MLWVPRKGIERIPKAVLRAIEEPGALTRFDFAGLMTTYLVTMAYGA
jgi:hypothetical protein